MAAPAFEGSSNLMADLIRERAKGQPTPHTLSDQTSNRLHDLASRETELKHAKGIRDCDQEQFAAFMHSVHDLQLSLSEEESLQQTKAGAMDTS